MKTIEIENIIETLEILPKTINVMLLGDTGIGKSSVVRKYCEKNGIYMQTLLLSTILASESLGIPMKDDDVSCIEIGETNIKIKTISTAIPKWVVNFIDNKERECVLFLDEFMCATPETQNAFLNFMCLKEINGIDLSFVRIILASNIGNYTYKLDKNMLNRICFINCVNSKNYLKEYLSEHHNNVYFDKLMNLDIDVTDYSELYKDDPIFEERNLSPRQITTLICDCKDEKALSIVYEGYTNKKYDDIKKGKSKTANLNIKITGNNTFDRYFINQLDIADNEVVIDNIEDIIKIFEKLSESNRNTIVVSSLDAIDILRSSDAKILVENLEKVKKENSISSNNLKMLDYIIYTIKSLIDKEILLA